MTKVAGVDTLPPSIGVYWYDKPLILEFDAKFAMWNNVHSVKSQSSDHFMHVSHAMGILRSYYGTGGKRSVQYRINFIAKIKSENERRALFTYKTPLGKGSESALRKYSLQQNSKWAIGFSIGAIKNDFYDKNKHNATPQQSVFRHLNQLKKRVENEAPFGTPRCGIKVSSLTALPQDTVKIIEDKSMNEYLLAKQLDQSPYKSSFYVVGKVLQNNAKSFLNSPSLKKEQDRYVHEMIETPLIDDGLIEFNYS